MNHLMLHSEDRSNDKQVILGYESGLYKKNTTANLIL